MSEHRLNAVDFSKTGLSAFLSSYPGHGHVLGHKESNTANLAEIFTGQESLLVLWFLLFLETLPR